MQTTSEFEAKSAITEVLYRYCRAMDRIDAELGYTVWHDDGTAHYSGLFHGAGSDFIDWVCELHQPMVATSHQVTNVLVDVAGDVAVSEAYVSVRLRVHNSDGDLTDIVGAGRYLDQWSCREDRWAIDHRNYVSDVSNSFPVATNDARSALRPGAAPVLWAQQDKSDPSYGLFGVIGSDLGT